MNKQIGVAMVVAFFIGLAIASCSLFGSSKGVVWPTIAECATDQAAEAVTSVENVLGPGTGGDISDAQVSQLEGLAVKYSANAVVCIIDSLIQKWTHAATETTVEKFDQSSPADAAARGRAFFHMKGVTGVKQKPPPP